MASIAIETSCRSGGVAVAVGDEPPRAVAFDASARHATELLVRLDALLGDAGRRPRDLREVYVSAGPGSFTGLRIGITVARTLGQAVAGLRCVAVPTALAIAAGARELPWQRLAVALCAKEGSAYTCLFARRGEQIVPAADPVVMTMADLPSLAPGPLTVVGEATAFGEIAAEGVTVVEPGSPLHLPTAENVWRVGREMARAEQFTDYRRLVPIYARRPEAVRLWEMREARDAE